MLRPCLRAAMCNVRSRRVSLPVAAGEQCLWMSQREVPSTAASMQTIYQRRGQAGR